MAPVDFEKELQDKLRSREIQPRPDSWDRIEARLQAQKSDAKGSARVWKILAAASIIFLFGYFLFPEAGGEVPQRDAVVQSPEPGVMNSSGPSEETRILTDLEKPAPTQIVHAEREGQKTIENRMGSANNELVKDQSEAPFTAQLADQSFAEITFEMPEEFKSTQSEVTAFKANDELQTGIDDSEVDALLYTALQVVKNRSNTKDTTALNPAILLAEVESELDETFRAQILKKLKMGFNKVRTGVADRAQ